MSDETKYSVPDGHWEKYDEDDEPAESDAVEVGMHFLEIYDERQSIDRYNGLVWHFVFDDDNRITGVDLSHYCPRPGHTDPMGFRRWDQVPIAVQEAVLDALNADRADEVVDRDACAEVVDGQPNVPGGDT